MLRAVFRVLGSAIGRTVARSMYEGWRKSRAKNTIKYEKFLMDHKEPPMISFQDAREILGLPNNFQLRTLEDVKLADERFEVLMTNNDPSKGGSIYLQSKIITARISLLQDNLELRKKIKHINVFRMP